MSEEDLQYWQDVLEGAREADPASGMDIEDLALALIEEVRSARRECSRLLKVSLAEIADKHEARRLAYRLWEGDVSRSSEMCGPEIDEMYILYPWLKE